MTGVGGELEELSGIIPEIVSSEAARGNRGRKDYLIAKILSELVGRLGQTSAVVQSVHMEREEPTVNSAPSAWEYLGMKRNSEGHNRKNCREVTRGKGRVQMCKCG